MVPSRRIVTPFIDYNNIFLLSLATKKNSEDAFTYTIRPNYDTQEVFFDLHYKENLSGQRIRIDVRENYIVNRDLQPLYDENKNLIIQNSAGYYSFLGDELRRVCYVSEGKKRTMRGLAGTLLAMYALTFLLLLLFSLMCWKKYRFGQLFAFWKFFLHMWCKL